MGFMLKSLGLIDVAAGASLLLTGNVPTRILLLLGGALIMKGIAFRGNAVSVFDAILGVYVLLNSFWAGFAALNVLFGSYLVLKGLYSFA
ncbi:hypothetical protein D6789_02450 [Candidatus Woesearchaeota archaeon]|nr:MAG: hypothetical protein D6789_02450 [Candidatus Woesearchaeota archaeon]